MGGVAGSGARVRGHHADRGGAAGRETSRQVEDLRATAAPSRNHCCLTPRHPPPHPCSLASSDTPQHSLRHSCEALERSSHPGSHAALVLHTHIQFCGRTALNAISLGGGGGTHTHAHTHTCTHTYMCTHTHMHTHTCTCVRAHTYTRTHTRVHTYTHTHTYIKCRYAYITWSLILSVCLTFLFVCVVLCSRLVCFLGGGGGRVKGVGVGRGNE